jgi:hypothetical protein
MGIKLDISKAYERVSWPFLEAAMLRMRFSVRWVQLVMKCVCSVTYSILINGSPVGNIQPIKGIRQGDQISPYLFLLCAEALSALRHQAELTGIITGVPTSPKGPKISHLFFANDNMLFCKQTQWNGDVCLEFWAPMKQALGRNSICKRNQSSLVTMRVMKESRKFLVF